MKITDISIDIETLGNRYDAAILSIAAVPFNRITGQTGTPYYAELLPEEALKSGTVNADTLCWWMRQSDRAKELFNTGGDKVLAFDALRGLSDMVRSHTGACVWGNGATFDITILEHAYSTIGCGLVPWWTYWSIRDMRTIVDAARIDKKRIEFKGTAHNARDDAIHQAKVISMCFQEIDKAFAALKKSTPIEDDEL